MTVRASSVHGMSLKKKIHVLDNALIQIIMAIAYITPCSSWLKSAPPKQQPEKKILFRPLGIPHLYNVFVFETHLSVRKSSFEERSHLTNQLFSEEDIARCMRCVSLLKALSKFAPEVFASGVFCNPRGLAMVTTPDFQAGGGSCDWDGFFPVTSPFLHSACPFQLEPPTFHQQALQHQYSERKYHQVFSNMRSQLSFVGTISCWVGESTFFLFLDLSR